MAINPMELLSLRGDLQAFDQRHPKLKMFLSDVSTRLDTGAVLEISVTDPQGNKIRTNFRVMEEDKQMLQKLFSLVKNK